jgi:hypothetical protein
MRINGLRRTAGRICSSRRSCCAHWRGVEGWHDHEDPADQSDYARACRVASSWLGSIPCSDGTAVVLGGDVGPIAWMPNLIHDGGVLVQWLGINDEQLIEPILRSEQLMQLLRAPEEVVEFHTGAGGTMRLFDSAEPGDDLRGDSLALTLKPGRYQIRAAYVQSTGVTVREVTRM